MSIQTPAPSSNTQSAQSEEDIILSNVEVSPEQDRYATILLVCSWTGICVMAITFLLYMSGSFNPLVEPSSMPLYWSMNVHQYAQATHAPTGWAWLKLINHGDYLNLVGLAFLGIVSVLGYSSLFIEYLRKKDLPYATMVGLEILVIVLAASGVLRIAG
ncbi:DUF1634 domain-containing protein [Desulfosporosinus metallidurans]|uniref:DUF1634 domain-containing protein n=1 Tax=Desulfosporosinus metallidurans TaxID=1888891 RepID=UPI00094CBF6F|nr:DUF1634 domain-containing protein [Desulfosporosinus metallidurans]